MEEGEFILDSLPWDKQLTKPYQRQDSLLFSNELEIVLKGKAFLKTPVRKILLHLFWRVGNWNEIIWPSNPSEVLFFPIIVDCIYISPVQSEIKKLPNQN